ncbi:MAG: DJ-1/PfpI family protein, partial [Pseudonocardiales bacterium]|nr:DJ-1/PfpI family protein [Pseudonocardiales bacterium]
MPFRRSLPASSIAHRASATTGHVTALQAGAQTVLRSAQRDQPRGGRGGYCHLMSLADKTVLVLAADLFEDVELLYPVYRLREEGVSVTVAGLDDKPVTGKKGHGPVQVQATIEEVSEEDY